MLTKENEPLCISVLGTIYDIKFGNEREYPVLADADGFIDTSIHTIYIEDFMCLQSVSTKQDLQSYQKQVLRHEILHAFLWESGLDNNSGGSPHWASNEEMVDWFAMQFPKIYFIYRDLDILG